MLYLIGLGLNLESISVEGLNAVNNCKTVYLESYTVDFPYKTEDLEKTIGKSIVKLDRKEVESNKLVDEAKNQDIALLVYGCPLFATTHITIIEEAKKKKVKVKVIYNASVLDALGETGLQLYKFGKITSMPAWTSSYKPDSFVNVVRENLGIKAHSLILCDIGLNFSSALDQLEESLENKNLKIEKIVVCSQLGTEKSKIHYDSIESLKKLGKKVNLPFCIVILGDLHFVEKEYLNKI